MIYDGRNIYKSCDLKENTDYLIKRLYDNKAKGIINEDYNGSARKAWLRELVKKFSGKLEVIRESKIKRKDIPHRDNSDELKEVLDRYNSGGGVDAIYKITRSDGYSLFILIEDKMQTFNPDHYISLRTVKKHYDKRFDRTSIRNYLDDKTFVLNVVFVSHLSMFTMEARKYLMKNYLVVETHTEFTPNERFGHDNQKYHAIKSALTYCKLGTLINMFFSDNLFKYTEKENPRLFNSTDNKLPKILFYICDYIDSLRCILYDLEVPLFKLPKIFYIVRFKQKHLDVEYKV